MLKIVEIWGFCFMGWDVMWQNYMGSSNSGFLRYGSILFLLDWDEMLHSYNGLDSLCEGFRGLLDLSIFFLLGLDEMLQSEKLGYS